MTMLADVTDAADAPDFIPKATAIDAPDFIPKAPTQPSMNPDGSLSGNPATLSHPFQPAPAPKMTPDEANRQIDTALNNVADYHRNNFGPMRAGDVTDVATRDNPKLNAAANRLLAVPGVGEDDYVKEQREQVIGSLSPAEKLQLHRAIYHAASRAQVAKEQEAIATGDLSQAPEVAKDVARATQEDVNRTGALGAFGQTALRATGGAGLGLIGNVAGYTDEERRRARTAQAFSQEQLHQAHPFATTAGGLAGGLVSPDNLLLMAMSAGGSEAAGGSAGIINSLRAGKPLAAAGQAAKASANMAALNVGQTAAGIGLQSAVQGSPIPRAQAGGELASAAAIGAISGPILHAGMEQGGRIMELIAMRQKLAALHPDNTLIPQLDAEIARLALAPNPAPPEVGTLDTAQNAPERPFQPVVEAPAPHPAEATIENAGTPETAPDFIPKETTHAVQEPGTAEQVLRNPEPAQVHPGVRGGDAQGQETPTAPVPQEEGGNAAPVAQTPEIAVEPQNAAKLEEGVKVDAPKAVSHAVDLAKALGGKIEHTSEYGSVYLKFPESEMADGTVLDPFTLRVSDHYVPETPERRSQKEVGFGPKWHELVIDQGVTPEQIRAKFQNALPDWWKEEFKSRGHESPPQAPEAPHQPGAVDVLPGAVAETGKGREPGEVTPAPETGSGGKKGLTKPKAKKALPPPEPEKPLGVLRDPLFKLKPGQNETPELMRMRQRIERLRAAADAATRSKDTGKSEHEYSKLADQAMDDYFAAGGREPDYVPVDKKTKAGPTGSQNPAQGELFSETKKALANFGKKRSGKTLGVGLGGVSDFFEDATHVAVALIKDLSRAGKHGFDHFVRAVSDQISNARLRAYMLRGEKGEGGARAIYNAARNHEEIVKHGLHNTMTPEDELPTRQSDINAITKLTPEQIDLRAAQRQAERSMPEKPPTETEVLREATVPGESTKATILRTTGARSTEEPTITASQALSEKLNVESALTNKAWLAADARTKITAAAKELPRDLRGDFLHAISTARNASDINNALGRMKENLATHQLREAFNAGAETLANSRIANLPPKFREMARRAGVELQAALQQVRDLPNRPRPKGEPSANSEARDAYRAMIEHAAGRVEDAISAGKKFMRDEVAKAGTTPPLPSEAEKASLVRRAADAAHDALNTREQYSYLRRDYNDDVQATAEHLIQAKKETVGTYNRFRAEALPKNNAEAMRVQADLVRLGWHNRINDMRNKAFDRAIAQGMSSEDAEAAANRVATGIPDTGRDGAAKIKADPLVRKAAEYWLKHVAPAQDANLARAGQKVEGWSSKAKGLADPLDGLMINLPPETPQNPAHFGVGRRSYDQSEAMLDPTTGNSDYQKDFTRVVQNNIGYPIRARARAEYAKAVEKGGFAFEPDDKAVRQADDGRAYVKVKGVERLAKPVLIDDANGEPQPKFVPQDLVDVHNFSDPRDSEKGKIAAALINSYVTARLALGVDVGSHAWRELGNVGEVLAREGNAPNTVPWAGGRALATERAYRTATLPHGEMLQLLAERGGFDRGTGYYVRDNEPTQSLGSKALKYGHQLLFGPKGGIDTNLRRVLAESYIKTQVGEEAYNNVAEKVNAGKMSAAEGADTLGDMLGGKGQIGMKNFVNRTLGENNHLLRAGFLNKLQFVMPFLGQNVGTLPSEFYRLGTGNVPFGSVAKYARARNAAKAGAAVVGGLMSGALGTYVAANLLNYGVTSLDKDKDGKATGGKWLWENPPGHRLTPYILPGVRWTNMSPGDTRPARDTGIDTAINKKSLAEGIKDIPRNMVNEILGTVPLLTPIMAMAGKAPYINPAGEFGNAPPEALNPFSFAQQTAKSAIQHARGEPNAEPFGQAVARDVAGLAGQRIAFDRANSPQTDAESYLRDNAYKGDHEFTPDDRERYQLRAAIVEARRNKDAEAERKALGGATLTPADEANINQRVDAGDDMTYRLRKADRKVAAKTYELMNPTEKAKYASTVRDKILNAKTLSYPQILDTLNRYGFPPPKQFDFSK